MDSARSFFVGVWGAFLSVNCLHGFSGSMLWQQLVVEGSAVTWVRATRGLFIEMVLIYSHIMSDKISIQHRSTFAGDLRKKWEPCTSRRRSTDCLTWLAEASGDHRGLIITRLSLRRWADGLYNPTRRFPVNVPQQNKHWKNPPSGAVAKQLNEGAAECQLFSVNERLLSLVDQSIEAGMLPIEACLEMMKHVFLGSEV
eukprot:s197_g19.t1